MAGHSIKLFQFIQKYYREIGIHPRVPHQINWRLFNAKNWMLLICLIQLIIPTMAFLFFEANSTLDCGLSTYFLLGLSAGGIFYVIYIWQIDNISKFIENCETFIKQSKLKNKPFECISNSMIFLCKQESN